MSLLLRAKSSTGRRLFANALQQFHFSSAKSADAAQKTPKSSKPRSQKSSDLLSPGSSQKPKNQMNAASTAWPKPKEIPYQAKVANFVNLVGHVEAPVCSKTASDGKPLAAIVISQHYSDGKDSLSIPVVFDGDLASVVASHVMQNDCVLVSGRLSEEPMEFSLGDNFGNFHVVAEDLNFVEGFRKNVSSKKIDVALTDVRVENSDPEQIELYEKESNIQQLDQQFVKSDSASGDSVESSGNTLESKPQAGGGWSENMSRKEKEEAMWRDLVKNPSLWWDYRQHKLNGFVKEKYPDFKHKSNGDSLWLSSSSAPLWVYTKLGQLEFDVKVMQGTPLQKGQASGGGQNGSNKFEELWKNLVENPTEWWDNRLGKRNPKAPDFKHKATGEVLWLSTLPQWALSKLPPSKDGQNAGQASPQAS